jgi:chorismate synthase
VLERASARETASRVAVGAVCRQFLDALGIAVSSLVTEVGGVPYIGADGGARVAAAVERARRDGDTLGGAFTVFIDGVKPGLGSFSQFDRKLDFMLAGAVAGIQAIKSVSFGAGAQFSALTGAESHDAVYFDGQKIHRKTNRAGGIEGGMSNGERIVVNAVMKPIPTLMCGLDTVDIVTGNNAVAAAERSDVCAIEAAAVVAEAAVITEITRAVLEKTGGDSMTEIAGRWNALPVLPPELQR